MTGRARSIAHSLIRCLALAAPCAPASRASAQRPAREALDPKLAAARDSGLRIVVSLARRRLWAIVGSDDTLLAAPVAVGSARSLAYGSQHWTFETPRGVHMVLAKEVDPIWIPPDWHYVEFARAEGLTLVWLHRDTTIDLGDGSTLVMRNARVRVEDDSTYEEFGGDDHIVAGNRLFVPPVGSPNRRVAGQLGKYRLALGDGVGIHGTPDKESIGSPTTHGCMRLYDADIEWLYRHIPVGTRVYIF